MKFLVCLLSLLAVSAFAGQTSYTSLLEEYEDFAADVKRRQVINDNYECKLWEADEPMISTKLPGVLRIKRAGKLIRGKKIELNFPQTLLHQIELTLTDSKTFSSDYVSLRRIDHGFLILKFEDRLYECHFPKREQNDDHLLF